MKNRFALLLLMLAVGTTACKKKKGCTDAFADNYNAEATTDDGSCTFKYLNISKGWVLQKFEVDGADSTAAFLAQKPLFTLTLFREKTFRESFKPDAGSTIITSGFWDYTESGTGITLIYSTTNYSFTHEIVSLSDTMLYLNQVEGGKSYNRYFRPKQ